MRFLGSQGCKKYFQFRKKLFLFSVQNHVKLFHKIFLTIFDKKIFSGKRGGGKSGGGWVSEGIKYNTYPISNTGFLFLQNFAKTIFVKFHGPAAVFVPTSHNLRMTMQNGATFK